MGETKAVGLRLPLNTIEVLDEEAAQLNMSRAEYCRKRLHAGRRLFKTSNKLDQQLLAALVEDDDSIHLANDLTTETGGLEDDIKAALPSDEKRSLSAEEVRRAVFGTKAEQREQINKTLNSLSEHDQIEITIGEDGDAEFYIDE